MHKLTASLAALLFAALSASAHAQNRSPDQLYEGLLDQQLCPRVINQAQTFVQSQAFGNYPVEARQEFLGRLVQCAVNSDNEQIAFSAVNAAKALGASWADYARLSVAASFKRDAITLEAFDTLSASAAQMPNLRSETVWRALAAAQRLDPTGARALAVHDRLVRFNYVPPNGVRDDSLRMEHARLLLKANRVADARARLAPVQSPGAILSIRIDRTFDPLRTDPAFERRLDLAAAAQADLVRARAESAATPRRIALRVQIAHSLRMLGQDEEALRELNGILSEAMRADGPERFVDYAEQLNWVLNAKAYVLYDLNRAEEARSTFRLAIGTGEDGTRNVSQVINFASRLVQEGRAREALETLPEVGSASSYGEMWIAAERLCAAEQLNDRALRDTSLGYLRQHEVDNPSALTRGLVCINDLDGAAASYIRRLQRPEHRDDALKALQQYREHDAAAFPFMRVLRGRYAAVRARADVRAAAEAVGHIGDVPLYAVFWGDD